MSYVNMLENFELQRLGSTPTLGVYDDAKNQWLYADWRGAYEPRTAHDSCQLLMECVRAYPYRQLLNNTQHVTSGWVGQEQWAGETLFPWLAEHGIRQMACIYSAHWAARYSLDITVGFASRPFVVPFDELASAYDWLQHAG